MDLLSSILAGMVQGITEWLPISSTGQSMIALIDLIGLEPERAFSFAIYLHLGTLLAVLFKMRIEVKEIILKLPHLGDDKLVQFIVTSTIFTAIIGVPVYWFLKENFKAWQGDLVTSVIGSFLILTGLVLYLSKGMMGNRTASELNLLDMAIAGISQGFAVLPGISRSGMTIAVLLFRNFRQDEALRLSFLISIPAIIGAILLDILQEGLQNFDYILVFSGILASFVFGYTTIDILLRFARRARFDLFCIAFGFVAILFYLVIPAL
ncbi:MAG: undecaprenyl-diphosphate phosphatase [Candidatus Altiarchaeales archaeon]|nr:MAG: undecaprenyl-diphosphate phosphatase [Candidatus Altiarchaeales archaeon]